MTRREEIVTATLGCRQSYADLKRPITPDDVADAFEKGAYWADKTMIDKACEVLKKHLFTQVVGWYDGEYSHVIQEVYTQVVPKFATAEDMIMVLRNEMEE